MPDIGNNPTNIFRANDLPKNEKIRRVAGESINAFRAVKIMDGKVFYYNSIPSDYNKIVGLSMNGTAIGNVVSIITGGVIDLTFPVIPNSIYYAIDGGELTVTPPVTGLCAEIGYALNESQLFIDIKDMVELI